MYKRVEVCTLLVLLLLPFVAYGQHDNVPRRFPAPSIGPYHLNMNTAEISKLVELSPAELKGFERGMEFKGERLYHVPPGRFAGSSWDVILGAVDNRVYKISALLVLDYREQQHHVWQNLKTLLDSQFGLPETPVPNVIIWDTLDGNVVMNLGDTDGKYAVVLTTTSSAVRNFVRTK